MYKFEWDDFATPELVRWICDTAGIEIGPNEADIKALIIQLFEYMGGPPVSNDRMTARSCEKIAKGLIEQALREAFSGSLKTADSKGYILNTVKSGPLSMEIEIGDLVHINWCSQDDLEPLPFIGQKLAERIVLERRKNGAFLDLKDFNSRIPGIGEKNAKKLEPCLSFDSKPHLIKSIDTLDDLIIELVDLMGEDPGRALIQVLEYSVSHAAKYRAQHWYTRQQFDRDSPDPQHECTWVGILRGSEYYKWLIKAIEDANQKIDIAMFHMVLPAKGHPTQLLINELVKAHKRGLDLRILLDQDRDDDPYKSAVINRPALELLQKEGIQARFDKQEQLLHSKFIVLDDKIVVLGSHNWSASSYFHYDDISLALESSSLAAELTTRFEELWLEVNKEN